jgi:poly(hydroxyalkanoate) depolymerase family esterase
MNPQFQNLMNEATRLTRAGDLQAATAAIRSALGATGQLEPAVPNPAFAAIDVEARELPQTRPEVGDTEVPGSFIAGSYANAGGHRDYKLYIPPTAGAGPLPLVVMLHGCTQNPDDFAAGTAMNEVARARGFYVLYPAQSRKANPQGCWNWFKHSHQQRGRGEAGLLAGMTREVMARHAVDPQRVYVAGLSAGGAMAAILGAAYPELYAAVGVHSGLAAGAASDLPSALAAMKGGATSTPGSMNGVPTIVFHGDADATVHAANADQVVASCAGPTAAAETQRVQDAGARACTRRIYRDAAGRVVAEHWLVHGAPHAWSGGSAQGSYTDSRGPDASAQMVRFFFEHPRLPLQ